jgi:hypothetical protein
MMKTMPGSVPVRLAEAAVVALHLRLDDARGIGFGGREEDEAAMGDVRGGR